jgi:ribosome maturation factor RimP
MIRSVQSAPINLPPVGRRLRPCGDAVLHYIAGTYCRRFHPSQMSGYLVDTNAIERLIEPSLEALGYRVVRVVFTGATLQVMAERRDDAPMSVDECALISNSVSALLDVADPVPGPYRLEVSSPGIERPVVKPADFDRFAGRQARIELTLPVNGRKRFRGRLLGVLEGTLRLATATGEEHLPLAHVARANLVLEP